MARPPRRSLGWSNPAVRNIVWQVLILAAIAGVGWFLVHNTIANLNARHITTGFGFLSDPAPVEIAEKMIDYEAGKSTYLRALIVGLLNTLKVSIVGIVLCTIIGTLVGIMRLSPNWLLNKLAAIYVEFLRDTPPLLQLLFWFSLLQVLPVPRQAIWMGPVVLSNRGIKFPTLNWDPVFGWAILAFLVAILTSFLLGRRAAGIQAHTGKRPRTWPWTMLLLIGLPVLTWAALGAPWSVDAPVLRGFNFIGGLTITPEYTALTLGLTIYTSAYVAEVVRSGILSVAQGQWEAAAALGLTRGQTLRLVVLPQSLRVIIPPLTSDYLNLTKNSSLAVAIGYRELVDVAEASLNQTGQAIENIAIVMGVFLIISLAISGLMNWYNARIALKER